MEELPYRVIKDGDVISTHKFSGQAINACKADGGSHVYYLNYRNFGTIVWSQDWFTKSVNPLPPKPEGGYL